jgi:TetR/AcrR family transcriptional regulator, ethionamide resistance regulator
VSSFISTASRQRIPGRYPELVSVTSTPSSPAPGRRRGARKGDAREADILRTFEDLIASKPLSAIGIDELALGAGISRSAFYFYFASKDAVLTALLNGLEESLLAENADWYEGLAAEPALRRSLQYSATLWAARGPLLRLIYQGSDVPEPVLQFRARSLERQQRAAVLRIENERATGLAPAGPPSAELLAAALIQLRTGLFCRVFAPEGDPGTPVDAEALIEDVLALMLRLLYGEVSGPTSKDAAPTS